MEQEDAKGKEQQSSSFFRGVDYPPVRSARPANTSTAAQPANGWPSKGGVDDDRVVVGDVKQNGRLADLKRRLEGIALKNKSRPEAERYRQAQHEKNKGNDCYKLGEYEEALLYYKLALALQPNWPAVQANRAAALIKLRRWRDAEAAATMALESDDRYLKALVRRAHARMQLKKWSAAECDVEAGLAIDPENEELLKLKEKVSRLSACVAAASDATVSPSSTHNTAEDHPILSGASGVQDDRARGDGGGDGTVGEMAGVSGTSRDSDGNAVVHSGTDQSADSESPGVCRDDIMVSDDRAVQRGPGVASELAGNCGSDAERDHVSPGSDGTQDGNGTETGCSVSGNAFGGCGEDARHGQMSEELVADVGDDEEILEEPEDPKMTSERRRQEGNECFKDGRYLEAIGLYSSAADLDVCSAALCHANMAQCHIHLRQWAKAEKHAGAALLLSESGPSVKVLMRRSKARRERGDFEGCKDDITDAFKLAKVSGSKADMERTQKELREVLTDIVKRDQPTTSSSSSAGRSTSTARYSGVVIEEEDDGERGVRDREAARLREKLQERAEKLAADARGAAARAARQYNHRVEAIRERNASIAQRNREGREAREKLQKQSEMQGAAATAAPPPQEHAANERARGDDLDGHRAAPSPAEGVSLTTNDGGVVTDRVVPTGASSQQPVRTEGDDKTALQPATCCTHPGPSADVALYTSVASGTHVPSSAGCAPTDACVGVANAGVAMDTSVAPGTHVPSSAGCAPTDACVHEASNGDGAPCSVASSVAAAAKSVSGRQVLQRIVIPVMVVGDVEDEGEGEGEGKQEDGMPQAASRETGTAEDGVTGADVVQSVTPGAEGGVRVPEQPASSPVAAASGVTGEPTLRGGDDGHGVTAAQLGVCVPTEEPGRAAALGAGCSAGDAASLHGSTTTTPAANGADCNSYLAAVIDVSSNWEEDKSSITHTASQRPDAGGPACPPSSGDVPAAVPTCPAAEGDGATEEEVIRSAGWDVDEMVESFRGLAKRLFAHGDFEGAEEGYSCCLRLRPDFVVGANNRAACRLKLEKYSEAVEDASTVLAVEPHNTKALHRRAQGYTALGEFRLALEDYRQALHVEPRNKEIKKCFSRVFEQYKASLTASSRTNSASTTRVPSPKSQADGPDECSTMNGGVHKGGMGSSAGHVGSASSVEDPTRENEHSGDGVGGGTEFGKPVYRRFGVPVGVVDGMRS